MPLTQNFYMGIKWNDYISNDKTKDRPQQLFQQIFAMEPSLVGVCLEAPLNTTFNLSHVNSSEKENNPRLAGNRQ